MLPPVVIEAGVHDPGLMRRHADRVLPVHELIVVQAGVLPIEEGDRRFEVGRDEWVLLRAGRRHRGYDDLSGDTWFYWICFGDRSLEDEEVAALFAGSRTGRVARRDRVRALLVDLVEDQESAVLTPSTARSYLQLIAAEVLLDPPAASRSAVNDVVHRAAGYISEHLKERELSTARVAAALAFDPDYLGRAFRNAFGETITDQIHRLRVDRARTLFRSTDLSIGRVAAEVGFGDERYFRRIFKRRVGLTPGQFQRLRPSA